MTLSPQSASARGDATALAGLRVADFSRVLAGPYATMLLADLGADVIKIESPAGDDTRTWTPPVDSTGRGTYFASVNRNKRSMVCDLATDEGRARAHALASSADVIVENFKPGTMERFGLGFERLRGENPRLVYCSITGFGAGAGAALPGYDLLVQAVGGLMSITGPIDGEPTKVGVALVDVLTGLHAVVGIQAALESRHRTGVGQRVDVNLLSTLLASLVNQSAGTLATGTPPGRLGNAHPSIAPYESFRAADGALIIAVGNDRQFAALCTVLSDPIGTGPGQALHDDKRFATNSDRVSHRAELAEAIELRLAAKPVAHWVAALTAAGVPAGPVNSIRDALDLAETLGLDPVVTLGEGEREQRAVANPIRLSRTPPTYRGAPPDLGEHDDATWFERA